MIDLTGRKFGRRLVIERAHTRLGKVRWLCPRVARRIVARPAVRLKSH
jgi:hypothetical protein